MALMALALAACAEEKPLEGVEGSVLGFVGGVAAEEPRAALVGRQVLASGGSAADAATAMYFTLSVTYPSAAGLGGGGVCLVHDVESGKIETLRFLPGQPADPAPSGTVRTAVPGNPAGFFALHARFGNQPWAAHVSRAEQLARFGTRASRALAWDIAWARAWLRPHRQSWNILAPDGQPLKEGQFLRQIDLAGILSSLRARGPGEFYRGRLSGEFAHAVRLAGGSMTLEDLRAYKPSWGTTIEVATGNHSAHFADAPSAGRAAAILYALLAADDAFEDLGGDARLHLIAEASSSAAGELLADPQAPPIGGTEKRPRLISESYVNRLARNLASGRHRPASIGIGQAPGGIGASSSTGFVAADRTGSAVACSLTMNAPFGSGRMAQGTGVFMAAAPTRPAPLSPVIVLNPNTQQVHFAAAGGGAPATPEAVPAVAAATMLAEIPLKEALALRRVSRPGNGDTTYFEAGMDGRSLQFLRGRGHRLREAAVLGRVSALHCRAGLQREPEQCRFAVDSRSHGLAATAEQ